MLSLRPCIGGADCRVSSCSREHCTGTQSCPIQGCLGNHGDASPDPLPPDPSMSYDEDLLYVPLSRQSSIQHLGAPPNQNVTQDPDIFCIHTSVEDLLKTSIPDLDSDQLDQVSDKVIKNLADLDLYQLDHPDEDTAMVASIRASLVSLQDKISNQRYSAGPYNVQSISTRSLAASPDVDIAETLRTMGSDLRGQIIETIKSQEKRIVGNVTKAICDSYNAIGVKCISSKGELRRAIKGLRSDYNTIFGELRNKVASIRMVSTEVTNNANASNDNFENITKCLSELQGKVSVLSEKCTSQEKINLLSRSEHKAVSKRIEGLELALMSTRAPQEVVVSPIPQSQNPAARGSVRKLPLTQSTRGSSGTTSTVTMSGLSTAQPSIPPWNSGLQDAAHAISRSLVSPLISSEHVAGQANMPSLDVNPTGIPAPTPNTVIRPPTGSAANTMTCSGSQSASIFTQPPFTSEVCNVGNWSTVDCGQNSRLPHGLSSVSFAPTTANAVQGLDPIPGISSLDPQSNGPAPVSHRDNPLAGSTRDRISQSNQIGHPNFQAVSSNVSLDSNSSRAENRLKRRVGVCCSLLSKITTVDLSGFSKAEAMEAQSFDLKRVESLKDDLKGLEKQCSEAKVDDHDLLDQIEETLNSALSWEHALANLQRKYYLHFSGEKSLLKGVELEKFDGSIDGQNIYSFLSTFSDLTDSCCSPKDKAQILFTSYIAKEIQKEVEPYKHDFLAMKTWLVNRYGDVRNIADGKLRKISSLKHPTNNNPQSQLQYYKTVESLLLACESLIANTPDENRVEIQNVIYSSAFVKDLVSYLPRELINSFVKKEQSEATERRPTGFKLFDILKRLINAKWREIDSLMSIRGRREQVLEPRVTAKVTAKPAESKPTVNTAAESKQSSGKVKAKITPKDSSSKPNHEKGQRQPPRNIVYKCLFHANNAKVSDHNLGECHKFFGGDNSSRFQLCTNSLACLTCFSKDCYSSSKGNCVGSIPPGLICPDCPSNPRPLNVLTCYHQAHKRPDMESLEADLTTYLKVLKPGILNGLKPFFNLAVLNSSSVNKADSGSKKPKSKSSKVDDSIDVPSFDTVSGKITDVDSQNTVFPGREDYLYVFQELALMNQQILCFYDSGASGNIIRGSLAEKVGFKVEHQECVPIGCLGDKSYYTDYGSYLAKLGPDEDGAFHFTPFQGLGKITRAYPRYPLSDIVKEVKASARLPDDTIFPEGVGGKEVDMLIGIHSPEIVPKLLFTMPSGIGVFKSAFADINNSRICFGGNHYSITLINKKAGSFSINQLTFMLSRCANQYLRMPFMGLDINMPPHRPMAIKLSEGMSKTMSSTPVDSRDLVLMTNTVPDPILVTQYCPHHYIHDAPKLSSNRAKVPISKLREMLDNEQDLVSYRCPACESCTECKSSPKLQASSIKDRQEQKLIDQSIHIDYDKKRVYISLPFTKDPIDFFSKHYKGNTNYAQALSIYKSQCRKSPEVKQGISKAMQELYDLGFVIQLDQASLDTQNVVNNSRIQHFYPWRSVYKDSISTPIRLVVDPTASLLNLIMAKGDSSLSSMFQILIQGRTSACCFSTDIRKLYNMMFLNPDSYPYSLFLYDDSMDPEVPPKVQLMTRAWYGNTATCSQSSTMLRLLGTHHASSHPLGAEVLKNRIYVDDAFSGCSSKNELLQQIAQLEHILSSAGLSMKYLVISGSPPPENASVDGKSISLLGYSWFPEDDLLALSISEINFQRRIRGMKPHNLEPVHTSDDIEKLVSSLPGLTRRQVTAKSSELYDPLGLIEPYNASLKRSLSRLSPLGWDDPIPTEEAELWLTYLKEWPLLENLRFSRSGIPNNDSVTPTRSRLITLTDASRDCGGAVVYLSTLKTDGSWSCTLLAAKSRLMKYTVPRNELSALLLGLELTYGICTSMSSKPEDVLILTDSQVALCWASNESARHKVFVQNRVLTINRFLKWIENQTGSLPTIAHIPGDQNISDILTKAHPDPTTLSSNSLWQNGHSWMAGPLANMPLTYFSDLSLQDNELQEVKTEIQFTLTQHDTSTQYNSNSSYSMGPNICLYMSDDIDWEKTEFVLPPQLSISQDVEKIEIFSKENALPTPSTNPPLPQDYLVDPIYFGWSCANRILEYAITFGAKCLHSTHMNPKTKPSVKASLESRCVLCKLISHNVTSETTQVVLLCEALSHLTTKVSSLYWDTVATHDCRKRLPKQDLQHCISDPNTGILFYKGRAMGERRIRVEDYDLPTLLKFSDKINLHNPCLLPDNPIFVAYTLHVHYHANPHCGFEATLREVLQRFYVFKPRPIMEKLLSICAKCKILQKKVLSQEMAGHSDLRFTIAPPFSHSQIDLAQPFHCKVRWKGRQTFKVPALVIVCIITGAVSIQMCEDWATNSVVQAIERHSCRYGVPNSLYIDQGAQLLKLTELKVNVHDLISQTSSLLSCQVIVAPPKSHSHQGKVERKILHIRQILDRMGENSFLQSFLGWETTMAKVSNRINSLPISRPSARSVINTQFDLLTANRILLGFNNRRALIGPLLLDVAPSLLLERAQEIEGCFFNLLMKRVHLLIPRSKWYDSDKIFPNDICLFFLTESEMKSRLTTWHYARVISVQGSRLILQYCINGSSSKSVIQRCKRQVVRICSEEELSKNDYQKLQSIQN